VAGLDLEKAPSLLGYIETKPKPNTQLLLTSESGDPLLIRWRYGLGIAVAFTSDIQSRWATAWLQWSGFGRFWSRLVRHAMRQDEARDFVLQVRQRSDKTEVNLEAIDPEGRFLNGAEVSVTAIGPDNAEQQMAAPQVAPGRYSAILSTPDVGAYFLEVNLKQEGRLIYATRRGVSVDYPDEYRTRTTNDDLLRAIAESSGGAYAPDPTEILEPPAATVARTTLLWPFLLTVAAVLFVIDVAVRRVVWSGRTP
jgi:hypothetical protein